MFGRNKTTSDSTDQPAGGSSAVTPQDAATPQDAGDVSHPHGYTAPKGRPTPRRRDQEAARRTPLVPVDRDAAKKEAKQRARSERLAQREAAARGDERALPARDRGPIKKLIRDYVDSRVSIGEILLPLMLIVLAISLVQNRTLQFFTLVAIWVVILLGIADSMFMWYRLKKLIMERFHEVPPKGSAMYATMRSFQMRLTRMPRPQVKRGAKI